MLEVIYSIREKVYLAHGFRSFSPRALGPVALGLWWLLKSWQECVAEEAVYLVMAKTKEGQEISGSPING
jgi:hypothetical protein